MTARFHYLLHCLMIAMITRSSYKAFSQAFPRNYRRLALQRCYITPPVLSMKTDTDGAKVGRASAAVQFDKEKHIKRNPSLDLNPVKGTRDVYPEDMRLRNWLFGKWRETARLYGFEEYDSPVLESEDLYIRKSGEEVAQQLFNFQDKGNRRVALRPEMTPSLARMVMARKNGLSLPLKWFSIPQCWRYERMTRGRRREHYQWNMDIWGIQGIEAEAELLAAIVSFLRSVGLTSADVGIKLNSRAVLGEILSGLGVPEAQHAAACVLVDKLEKIPLESLKAEMANVGLSEPIVGELVEIMKAKSVEHVKHFVGADSAALSDLKRLFQLAEEYGYSDWILFDASVVRGLSYYTGIVFEGFDRSGSLRAIFGGGRYNRLLESFGGDPLPACGFGFGDAVITELLVEKGLQPSFLTNQVDAMIFPLIEELRPAATKLASSLRASGLAVDLFLEPKKPKWAFKHADRIGARLVCVVGPDEWAQGKVAVKRMGTGEQTCIDVASLAAFVGGEPVNQ